MAKNRDAITHTVTIIHQHDGQLELRVIDLDGNYIVWRGTAADLNHLLREERDRLEAARVYGPFTQAELDSYINSTTKKETQP